MDPTLIKSASAKHPRPDHHFTYGTAGFRMKADLLDSVIFRTGLLAVLRSKSHHGKYVGVMVTASHNPEEDNGVKLVEPLGEMLESRWESYAMNLANALTDDDLIRELQVVVDKEGIDINADAKIVVGRDTRPSGPALVAALKDGVNALKGTFVDHELKTTPQLHYLVRCLNTAGTADSYGEPTEEGYYHKLATAFKQLVHGKKSLSPLHVDAANGIGAPALTKLASVIGQEYLQVTFSNNDTVTPGKLNHKCGADFVKLYQKAPEGAELTYGIRACSLDGDADRIVFYYADKNGVFRLLDGDKIATLASDFIMTLIRQANVKKASGEELQVGVVQTAYANGSSTSYIRDTLKVPVVFTPTGVKHLHHAAEEFDVGVYFEANGHGTVLFSPDAIKTFRNANGTTPEETSAIESLRSLVEVINQTVGDALSDLLMVEAVLVSKSLSFEQWDSSYTDLPSKQEKVKVADRSIFVPINADTELSKPDGLQAKINQQVAKFQRGRCFVRPSGTEDIVRVYAEAATPEETASLSAIVCGIVFDGYGGVGTRPAHYKSVDADGNII